jgi:hypothetical protein
MFFIFIFVSSEFIHSIGLPIFATFSLILVFYSLKQQYFECIIIYSIFFYLFFYFS